MRLIPDNKDLGWTPYAWAVYVVFFAAYPLLKASASPGEWAATILGVALFFPLYFGGYWVHGRNLLLIIAALTVLGLAYFPFNPGAGSFFIYAAAFASDFDRPKYAAGIIGVIELAILIEAVACHIHPFSAFWPMAFTIIIGATNIHFRQVARANDRLKLAHDEISHLAKVAERERIARDLHDLLGHTLSVVILKSELASKLAERDSERARREIQDVERIAREALAQVRDAVRGYRSRGIAAEITEAREALRVSGVQLETKIEGIVLPPTTEAVITLAIREAVTNVVRHARATRCAIEFSSTAQCATLTIADDGRGLSSAFGSGLNGMRERLESLGGTLTRTTSAGTLLTIQVPLGNIEREGARSA